MRDLATRKVRVPCSGFAPYLELTFSSVYQSASLSMRRANLIGVQVVITQAMLQEAWDGLRGAVTIAYPQGLPEYDEVNASSPCCCCRCHRRCRRRRSQLQVQAILDDNFDPDSITQECVPADAAELWWAGKKMTRDKLLSDFVGRNDKTKVCARVILPLPSSHRHVCVADRGQAAETRRWSTDA
jgi:hypothetical protein